MKYPNVNQIRAHLLTIMEAHTTGRFTNGGIVDEAISGGILAQVGLSQEDMVRYMLLGEVERLRSELSKPAVDGQPTLPGMSSITESQLWNLGKGESIWAVSAQYEDARVHWALIEENRGRVNAQAEKARADLFDTGLMQYLLAHPGTTVGDFCELLSSKQEAS